MTHAALVASPFDVLTPLLGATPAELPLWPWFLMIAVVVGLIVSTTVIVTRQNRRIHRAEEQAQACEGRLAWFESFFNSAESAIIGVDRSGRMTSLNPAALQLLGRGSTAVVGHPVGEIEAAGHRADFEKFIEDAARGNHPGPLETLWRRPDGTTVAVALTCSDVRDLQGRSQGAVIIAQDVSAQKEHERTLCRTRDLLSAVLNASAAVIMAFESVRSEDGHIADFRWTMVNPAAERLVRRSSSELLGQGLLETLPDNLGRDLFGRFVAVVETGEADSFLHRHRREEQEHWFQVDIVKMADGFTVLFGDVTTAVQAEAENRQLAAALRHSRDAITVRDLSDRILSWNEGAQQMYGFRAEEAIDQPFSRLLLPGSAAVAETPRLIHLMNGSGRLERFETTRRTKDGRTLDVWLTATVLTDEQGKPYAVTTIERDVTAQKEAERKLDEAFRNLADRNNELRQFASVASHDLQEPLRMISSYVQLLERKYGEQLDSQALSYIRFARDGAQRMGQLIRDLLRYSELGSHLPQFSEVDLGVVVSEAALNVDEAGVDAAKLIVEVKGPLPMIEGDPIQLRQVFQNLLSNAAKFRRETPARVEVSARATDGGAAWQVDVRDNGIGIDPRFADQIFMPFKRLHSRQTYSGTGIGLAICRRIVDRHGGRIWVDSTPGQGSVFSFTLPAMGVQRPAPRMHDPG